RRRLNARPLDNAVRPHAHLARPVHRRRPRPTRHSRESAAMQKLMFAAAAALCALAAAPPAAQAATPGGLNQVKVVHGVVRYATAELASPAAADRLFLRIRYRATPLCR